MILGLKDIHKTYRLGGHDVHALRGVNLQVAPGEMLAVAGASGSGKSTLLQILGCLDRPDGGQYILEGHDVAGLSKNDLAEVRGRRIGFVFQSFNLLPRLNALENVELPLLYRGTRHAKKKAAAMLERVGLGDRMDHRPSQLSGGQAQRVAIARALVTEPAIVLADEPTGNLDSATSAELMDFLKALHLDGLTLLIVTHEPDVAAQCPRRVRIRDGLIEEQP